MLKRLKFVVLLVILAKGADVNGGPQDYNDEDDDEYNQEVQQPSPPMKSRPPPLTPMLSESPISNLFKLHSQMALSPFTSSPFASSPFASPPFSSSPFASHPFSSSPFRPSPFGSPSFGPRPSIFKPVGSSDLSGPTSPFLPDLQNLLSKVKENHKILEKYGKNGQHHHVENIRQCCKYSKHIDCRDVEDEERCNPDEYLRKATSMLSVHSFSGPFDANEKESNPSTQGPTNNGPFSASEEESNPSPQGPTNNGSFSASEEESNPSTQGPSKNGNNGMIKKPIGSGSSKLGRPKQKIEQHEYQEPLNVDKEEVEKIRRQLFDKTNLYRRYFQLPLLKEDENLNNFAQDWANTLAHEGSMYHRPSNNYGENIYVSTPVKRAGGVAADSWFNELEHIKVGDSEESLSSNGEIGHLTQMLWKESTHMGVGVARNLNNRQYYIVANYNPTGNVITEFKSNLPIFKAEDIKDAKLAAEELRRKFSTPISYSYDPYTQKRPTSEELLQSMENFTIGIPHKLGYTPTGQQSKKSTVSAQKTQATPQPKHLQRNSTRK